MIYKGMAVGVVTPLLWLALQERVPLWLVSVILGVAAVAIFRFVPPRPQSTPRQDAVVTVGTIAAAMAVGLLFERL